MAGNQVITFMEPFKLKVETIDYPKLANPKGKKIEHGAILKMGDLCSVPFNVSCGRCRNCKERHTDVCMNVNDQLDCGAYGFNLGNWQGGQADYLMVPYADWNLLAFPRQGPGDGEDPGPDAALGHPADRLPRLRRGGRRHATTAPEVFRLRARRIERGSGRAASVGGRHADL